MGLSLSTRKSIKGRSGKEFKRILRRSDMSVIWQALTPYYAIQNGKLVDCPNATAWSGGYNNSQGEVSSDQGTLYGGVGHTTANEDEEWGANTGAMQTKGCKYMTVIIAARAWGSGMGGFTLYFTASNGAKFGQETLPSSSYDTEGSYYVTRTFDISSYGSTVSAYINYHVGEGDGDNGNVYSGFNSIRFHN